MKKLLFITTRVFWPTDSGRKYSLYHYCKGLHDKYGYDVYIYSFLENYEIEKYEPYPYFIKELKLAKKVSKTTKLFNLFCKSLFGRWPFQCSILFSADNLKRIKEYSDLIEPDAVIVDMLRLAPYIKAFDSLKCKKILDMDDLLSERYKNQLKNTSSGDLFGAFAGKNLFNKIVNSKPIKNIVLKSEAKRVFIFENKYGTLYDNVVFVSEKETKIFNNNIGMEKGVTIRVGVDYSYYNEIINVHKKDGYLAFLGNLKYAPNISSLKLIVNEILPKLNFDYKLIVIGSVTQDVINSFDSDRIVFKGRVDDLRIVISECEMFVSPIVYGSGIKTKILEAFALGIPVITNDLGVEGLDGTENVIKVVNNYNEMSCLINDYHSNKEKLDKISILEKQLVKDYYQWDKIFDSFKLLDL